VARVSVREQIVIAGLAELHARGYSACSVEDITKAAGVPKGSFYNHFGSKEEFAAEAVRRYFEVTGWPSVFDEEPAIARLRAGFEALYAALRDRTFSQGCMWGNLANEIADNSDAVRGEIARGLDRWSEIITDLVAEAQRNGETSAAGDPGQLGRFIVNSWEGAVTRSRVVRSEQPFRDFFVMIFDSLLA
jgi:TetR/AcrR family transcriptional regulator, transcriptional repressor for nem operon